MESQFSRQRIGTGPKTIYPKSLLCKLLVVSDTHAHKYNTTLYIQYKDPACTEMQYIQIQDAMCVCKLERVDSVCV